MCITYHANKICMMIANDAENNIERRSSVMSTFDIFKVNSYLTRDRYHNVCVYCITDKYTANSRVKYTLTHTRAHNKSTHCTRTYVRTFKNRNNIDIIRMDKQSTNTSKCMHSTPIHTHTVKSRQNIVHPNGIVMCLCMYV